MAVVSTKSPFTGFEYKFKIAGDQPTQQEREVIAQYLIATEKPLQQAPEDQELIETESQGFFSGVGSGVFGSLAQIPAGIVGLGESVLGYNPGETTVGQIAGGASDYLQSGVDYVFGEATDDPYSKAGQTLGSVASFFIPGLGVAKGASLAGAGAKTATALATATAATQGVALGSKEQMDRIQLALENGEQLSDDQMQWATILGGGVGSTEALPIGRLFGQIGKMLRKVPKEEKQTATSIIARRLKNAGTQGLIEGGQEVGAAIMQDLVEQNIYNPDLEITASAYQDDAIYGGGAGATLQFLIDTVGGRRVRKQFDKDRQLENDLREESNEKQFDFGNAQASLGFEQYDDEGNPVQQLLPQPEKVENLEVNVVDETTTGPTEKQLEDSARLKRLALDPTAERELQAQKMREITVGGFAGVDLKNLPDDEQLAVRQYRTRTGIADVDSEIGIQELQDIVTDAYGAERGIAAYNREATKQKPAFFEPKLTEAEQAQQKEASIVNQKVIENFEDMKQSLKDGSILAKDGVISIPKIQRKYKMKVNEARAAVDALAKKGHATPISPTQHKAVLPEGKEEPVQSDKHIKLREFESQLNALRVQAADERRKLQELKERGATNTQEQMEIENQQRVADETSARVEAISERVNTFQALANQSQPDNADRVNAVQITSNEARQAMMESLSAKPTDEYKRTINTVANNLRKYLFKDLGLSDVDLVTQNVLEPERIKSGHVVEAYETSGDAGRRMITIAMEVYNPNLTEAQLTQRLKGVVNHEVIHSLRSLGVITDAEFSMLVKAATNRKYVRSKAGKNLERDYTFMERASIMNRGQSQEYIAEEAVAEMFRAYADGRIKVGGKPKGIFQKIVRFFKSVFRAHSDAGFNSAAELFDGILAGKVGKRQRNLQKAAQAPAGSRYSTAGVRAGYMVPLKGDIERIGQNFKDVTKRVPELEKAANRLADGEITYEEYDNIVNEFKPIMPYQTVPAPETMEDMRRALSATAPKKLEKLGKASNIEVGTPISLRLDIPAYRYQGVWVPTIHDSNNRVIAHEATAVIQNVSFSASERTGLRIAQGGEKGPYATIKGSFVGSNPDADFALAQQLLLDPSVVQVGFDPTRHAYFYDRVTTQPVIGADLVVQVGPLVLAKNPQFGRKPDFKYSVARLPNTPSNLLGPIDVVHDVKDRYLKSVGMPMRRQAEYVQVNEDLARRIAGAFQEAEDSPLDPDVRAAYKAMADETKAQWQFIKDTGINIEFIKQGQDNPYPNGSRDVLLDIRDNNHMWVFPTEDGFGVEEITDEQRVLNPLLDKVGERIDGLDVTVNDLFRIVHDYFGHGLEGATFTARGEENAWQAHVRMYSPLAARAMTTETRGQNSWVNYGPYGDQNRANPGETVYADQKLTLLPDFVVNEGVAPDLEIEDGRIVEETNGPNGGSRVGRSDLGRVGRTGAGQAGDAGKIRARSVAPVPSVNEDGKVRLTHYSSVEDIDTVDPERHGSNVMMRGDERERRVGFSSIYPPRSYYGLNVGEDGGYSKSKDSWNIGDSMYITEVPLESLYNWDADPENFKDKAIATIPDHLTVSRDRSNHATTMTEKLIKDSGYLGYYANSPMGLAAAVFNPLKVRPNLSEAPKYSIARLTPEQYKLTSLGNVNTEVGDPENRYYIPQAPYNTVILVDAAQNMQNDRGNVVLDWSDPNNWEEIATLIAAEAEAAYSRDGNAIGWYDKTLSLAKRITSVLFPDVKPGTADEAAYQYATAVTSNGIGVIPNWQYAAEQYRNWKETGKFIEKGFGNQGGSMVNAFALYNTMKDMGYTDLEIKEFLSQKMTVRELRQNNVVRALGITVDAKESVDTEVYVSYIMGPKIGQGFYQNLNGNFETLTMDRWWMRMFNRITGEPFKNVTERTVANNEARVLKAVNNMPLREAEAELVKASLDVINADIVTDANVQEFAIELNNQFQNYRVRRIKAGYGEPKKSELLLAADTAAKNFTTQMQEDPRTAKQRTAMRAITNRAREILKEDLGIDINNADFQALMWYPEKNLFYSYGVRKGIGDDNDYIDGAIALLQKEGYDVETIAEALPEADRVIVRDRANSTFSTEESGDVTPITDGQEEGSPRTSDQERKRSIALVPERSYSMSNSRLAERVDQQTAKISYNNVSGLLSKVLGIATYKIPKALGIVTDKDRAEALSERFFTKYQDALLPVGKLYDELSREGADIVDAHDAYLQEELAQGRAGYQIEKNQQELFEPLAESVKALDATDTSLSSLASGSKFVRDYLAEDQSPKIALAEAFLYARHARERNAYILNKYKRGVGSGMSDQEADFIMDWVAKQDPALRSQLDTVASFADGIVQSTNKIREDGDLIPDPATVQADPEGKWQPTNFSNYVPLRGTMEPDEEASQDYRNSSRRSPNLYGSRGRLEARMQGRGDSYAVNILANLMAQNQQSVQKAERNKVGKAFYELITNRDIDTSNYGEVIDKYDDSIRDNILTVKINGEEKHIEIFDDRIARALKGAMTPTKSSSLVRFMGKINRVLSNLNTSWNPEFVISNFARDLETAAININQYEEKEITREIVKNALPAVKGIAGLLRGNKDSEWARIYEEFVKAGGKNATNQMSDLQDQVEQLKGIVDGIGRDSKSGKLGLVKNGFSKLGKFLEDYNTAVENGVRIATFDALRKRGYSEQRAAQAARNVTVNFAKGGEDKVLMNSLFLFYNASLQGSMALANAAVRSPKVRALWGSMFIYGMLQDQLMGALSDDEDGDGKNDYDELSDYTLEHNLILPNPFAGVIGGKFIKIPLAYGLNMATNTGRSISRVMRGEYTVGQASETITGTMLELLNPLGSGIEDWENIAAPTVVDPFVSLMVNKDYKGDPIYKFSSPFGLQKPDSQMYWNNTSPVARTIAQQINSLTGGTEVTPGYIDFSPDVLEFWFDYVTGAAGAFVRRSVETPVNVTKALAGDFDGDLSRTLPIVRKLTISPSSYEDVGVYIENRDKILSARKELETAMAYRDPANIRRVRAEYETLLSIYGNVKRIDNARNRLIRQKNTIRNNPIMPEARKTELIAKINERISQLVKEANKTMYDAGIR